MEIHKAVALGVFSLAIAANTLHAPRGARWFTFVVGLGIAGVIAVIF